MDKILQTFRNLYSGENVIQKHLMYLLVLLMPAFSTAAFNMVDKDNPQFITTFALLGIALGIIAIPMSIVALGIFVKFIHNKYKGGVVFPEIDFECLKKGGKTLPIFLVWCLYGLILFVLWLIAVCAIGIAMGATNKDPVAMLAFLAIVIISVILLAIFMFLISPFVNLIFIKFAKDYQYKGEYFNPISPFKYMANNFKPLIVIALKYLAVSIVTNVAAYIIVFLVGILLGIIATLLTGGNLFSTNQAAYMVFTFLVGACSAWMLSYVSGIVNLAYIENTTGYYISTLDNSEEVC